MVVVPNPTKTITANYTIDAVKKAIKELPKHASSAELVIESDPMNFFKFKCKGKGFFNEGMFVEINLNTVEDTKTEIHLECRRQLGWITDGAELTETVNYMIGTITLLGKVLSGEKKL